MSDAEDTSSPARYRIGAVARATGIQADTLRVWERRYGALSPERTSAGGRLYRDEDIVRLKLIRQLLERGHSIGRLATLPEEELRSILARHASAAPSAMADLGALRARFIDSALHLELPDAQRTLQRAALLLDPRTFAIDLVIPILREIGALWADGSARICHEHGATVVIRNVIGTLIATQPELQVSRTLLATTPPGELHEMGAMCAALLASGAGWGVVYLGPNLPAENLIAAAAQTGAAAVALSFIGEGDATTAADVERVANDLPGRVQLVAGGPAARAHSALSGRAVVLDDLREFDVWLRRRQDEHGF